jgi:hypothetical protein
MSKFEIFGIYYALHGDWEVILTCAFEMMRTKIIGQKPNNLLIYLEVCNYLAIELKSVVRQYKRQ